MLTDLHLDPTRDDSCRTARWLNDVAPARDLDVRWRPHSRLLAESLDTATQAELEPVHRAMRVAERAREEHGDAAASRFYAELTRRLTSGQLLEEDDLDGLLLDVGLDPVLVAAAVDPGWDDEIRGAMEEAEEAAGVSDPPVIVLRPTRPRAVLVGAVASVSDGEEALRLFDRLLARAGDGGRVRTG